MKENFNAPAWIYAILFAGTKRVVPARLLPLLGHILEMVLLLSGAAGGSPLIIRVCRRNKVQKPDRVVGPAGSSQALASPGNASEHSVRWQQGQAVHTDGDSLSVSHSSVTLFNLPAGPFVRQTTICNLGRRVVATGVSAPPQIRGCGNFWQQIRLTETARH